MGALVAVVVLGSLFPQLLAWAFRSTPTPVPAWSDEAARVSAACKADPALCTRVVFTPFLAPDWVAAFSGPTYPHKCGLSRGVEVVGLGQSFKARMCGPLWEQLGEVRVTGLGDFFKYCV
jgi:hypothetical protein